MIASMLVKVADTERVKGILKVYYTDLIRNARTTVNFKTDLKSLNFDPTGS